MAKTILNSILQSLNKNVNLHNIKIGVILAFLLMSPVVYAGQITKTIIDPEDSFQRSGQTTESNKTINAITANNSIRDHKERLAVVEYATKYQDKIILAVLNREVNVLKYLVDGLERDTTLKKLLGRKWLQLAYKAAFFESYKECDLETLKFLVERGVDVKSNKATDLFILAKRGYLDIIKYLVDTGVDIRANNNIVLITAVENRHLDIVKYLIERGVDFKAKNKALIISARKGYLDLVKYLVENGAEIRAKNDAALSEAVRNNNCEVVEYLIKKGNYSILDKFINLYRYEDLLIFSILVSLLACFTFIVVALLEGYNNSIKER